jgi:2-amino-4-hydroxy-6-hydroxymethyldihydropteridine diphosphokinase
LPSRCGSPIATLIAVRPLLEASLRQWGQGLSSGPTGFRWSPLFETEPVGGPPGQPPYINAVLVVDGLVAGLGADGARAAAGEALLEQLQALEHDFGRERQARWAPRSLDLDLLWWGNLSCHTPRLQLPHPLWRQRDFVLAPLAALAGLAPEPGCAVIALAGRPGWPEQLG